MIWIFFSSLRILSKNSHVELPLIAVAMRFEPLSHQGASENILAKKKKPPTLSRQVVRCGSVPYIHHVVDSI